MKTLKNVLILTDGSAKTEKLAVEIAAALKGNEVLTKTASEFKGNDILPAEVFFLGCEEPEPGSFSYLADLLKHVNLAGRTCGVFSSGSEKTTKYLASLVEDCEAAINPKALFYDDGAGLENWAQSVISRSF